MIHKSDIQLLELPDRKEITLCEAVSAFVYGKAADALQHLLDLSVAPTDEQSVKANDLLGRLQSAAYAGRIKLRALKNGENHLDGHKDIDPLYFGIRRGFDWLHDQIWNQDLDDPVGDSVRDWRDVHLDREDFVSLLRDMGVSVYQKTSKTGAPGRPNSSHFVLQMARRRFDAGDIPPTLKEFSKQLAEQLAIELPQVVPLKPKTIENTIREMWRARERQLKAEDPS